MTDQIMWIDASAGIAGDMLLGALIDAGAPLDQVQRAVDAVIPGSVRLRAETVERAGMRATKLHVDVLVEDPPHRTWSTIRTKLAEAELPEQTRAWAHDAFERLAVAEARVHGTSPDDVHFHEVGALDSIADTVGACEAIRLLGVGEVVCTPVAVGSGFVKAAHGRIPVPVPAVVELSLGFPTTAGGFTAGGSHGGHTHAHPHAPSPEAVADFRRNDEHTHAHDHPHPHSHSHSPEAVADFRRNDEHTHARPDGDAREPGELATPTGLALVRALATGTGGLPGMVSDAVGVGAGTKDFPGHANVVRVVLGRRGGAGDRPAQTVHQLECNVDDLDPRLWPGVIDTLLEAGAADAWLTPITMKRGRPAHTLHALAADEKADAVADAMLAHTTTLGVRRHQPLHRITLERGWADVELAAGGVGSGRSVPVKVAHDGAVVRNVAPEFRDVSALAAELGVPELEVLEAARAAASAAGIVRGAAVPEGLRE